ncbi:MAG: NADPH-dependent FMN reductase [Endozoicomonas sp.]
MNIVAFGTSTSSTSINKALATYAANLIKNASVTILDLNDYKVPIFSEDKEKEIGKAAGAEQFLSDIGKADALIISFAEHNGHYPAAYKNLFDWATRIERKVYQNKPAVYLSTSNGANGASSVLAAASNSANSFGSDIRASISVPKFLDNFDLDKGEVTNPSIITEITDALNKLV